MQQPEFLLPHVKHDLKHGILADLDELAELTYLSQ